MKTIERTGSSSTGSKHGLRVEMAAHGVRFVVTGVNGKRHAAVLLGIGDSADVAKALTDYLYGSGDD
jgi:hypothetical protein